MGRPSRGGCGPPASFAWLAYNTDLGDSGLVVASAGLTTVKWYHFKTTDPDCFYTSAAGNVLSNTAGDVALTLRKPGVYRVHIRTNWTGVSFTRFVFVNDFFDVQDIGPIPIEGNTLGVTSIQDLDTSLFIQGYAGALVQFANGLSYVGYIQVRVQQNSGSNKTLRRAYMTVSYSPTDDLATVYGT